MKMNKLKLKLKYGGSETRTVADDGRIVMSFAMRGGQRLPKGHQGSPQVTTGSRDRRSDFSETCRPGPPPL